MKIRIYKRKKVRCSRQAWVDNGFWASFSRRADMYILKIRAQRKSLTA